MFNTIFAKIFIKKIQFSLNIPPRFGIITIASSLPLPNWGEVAEYGGQVARAFVSADTQKSIILHHK